ncbi:MAG: His/Gly/Thr/Pro-type tRNA ligase C-terminal domain-containing protein, partial [Pseudomonadales bacterium]
VDACAYAIADFCCGANREAHHHVNVNWERDVEVAAERIVDARNVTSGEPAPDGQGTLTFLKGIEVGHIFQLGRLYSESMNASVQDRDGKSLIPIMGCYGMGVTRLIAAIIEQNHDEVGIKWPIPVAPFQVHIVALNYSKSEAVRAAADGLYQSCLDKDMEVLLDDTENRPGVKFADADLIGIPHRITVGDRALKEGNVEYLLRCEKGGKGGRDATSMPLDTVLDHIDRSESSIQS